MTAASWPGALADLDLTDLAQRREDRLSGGQRQRAFLAMAQSQDMPWTLLDEPLAALDPKYTADDANGAHVAQGAGRGIVVVTHDLTMAARHAEWVLCLKHGQLHRAGPVAATLTGDNLSGLVGTPVVIDRLHARPVVLTD